MHVCLRGHNGAVGAGEEPVVRKSSLTAGGLEKSIISTYFESAL